MHIIQSYMIVPRRLEGVLICLNLRRTEAQVAISADGLLSLLWSLTISWTGHCDSPACHSGLRGFIVPVLSSHAASPNRLLFKIFQWCYLKKKKKKRPDRKDSFNIASKSLMFRCVDKSIAYNHLLFTKDSGSVCSEPSALSVSKRMKCSTVFLFCGVSVLGTNNLSSERDYLNGRLK